MGDAFEGFREMIAVGEPGGIRDFFDRIVGNRKKVFRLVDSPEQLILLRSHADIPFEDAYKIVDGDIVEPAELIVKVFVFQISADVIQRKADPVVHMLFSGRENGPRRNIVDDFVNDVVQLYGEPSGIGTFHAHLVEKLFGRFLDDA